MLKDLLKDIAIPPGTKLFMCNATSMYTNIQTGPAIEHISHYLHSKLGKIHHYDVDTLIEATLSSKIMALHSEMPNGNRYLAQAWRSLLL